MPTLFVTGGCGFIGSNFVRHLLATDPAVRVINFDALTYAGNLANLADVANDPRYTFVKGDITDRAAVRHGNPRRATGLGSLKLLQAIRSSVTAASLSRPT